MKNLNSTSNIRNAGKKNPDLQTTLLQAVQPAESLVEEFVARIHAQDVPVISLPASTKEELDDMWQHMETVDASVQRSDTTKVLLNDKDALQVFLQPCCTFGHYFLMMKMWCSRLQDVRPSESATSCVKSAALLP